MSDQVTSPSASRPDPYATTHNPAGDAADGSSATPDSTAVSSRPQGNAPVDAVTIPGYEIRDEIARGGMGRVLAAYDLSFGRDVAIKVVLPGPDAAVTAGRFVRESRITGRLAHPGIPPAYQLGELADGSPFLAMKLIRGQTLAALLAERPGVSHDLPRFVGIVEQVCQAVGYAHSQGVIHRDLKPANVMVGAFGEVQVMDWGLAKEVAGRGREAPGPVEPRTAPHDATGSTVVDDHTHAGAVMGTPAYMAPEQARGEDVDARADVFALGGLLASVLAGRAQFGSSNAATALALAATGDTSAVLDVLTKCRADAELVGLTRHCLAPAAVDRPADGTAVAALVAAYRSGVEERLRATERARAAAEARATEQRKRRRVQSVLAAAVVLLVAGAGGVAVWWVQDAADKKAAARRLEEEERARRQRGEDGVAALLDRAKAGLEAGDADRADPFLAQAARRAADDGLDGFAARLAVYQRDRDLLRELDRVDDFRRTPTDAGFYPSDEKVVGQWEAAFSGYGIIPGTTPAAEAAARVNAATVRVAILAALDGWLVRSPSGPLRAVLDAADPNPFRAEVRRLLAGRDQAGLAALAGRPEWTDQPTGLVQAFGVSPLVPIDVRQKLLTQAAGRRPDNFSLLMELGGTYRINTPSGSGDRVRWYQAAIALRPRNCAAHNSLGTALRDKGDLDDATAAHREAIRLDPKVALFHSDLGYALRIKGDLDGARAAYREVIRLDPNSPWGHGNLGVVLHRLGDHDGAVACYTEVVRLSPQTAQFRAEFGMVLLGKGELARAEAECREAIRLDPENAPAHFYLCVALRGRGDLDGALEAAREFVRVAPDNGDAHAQLGWTHRTRKEYDQAAVCYAEVVRLLPANVPYRFEYGMIFQEKGDLDGAAAAYREVIRLDPKNPWGHGNLGAVLRRLGDHDGAVACYAEAVRLSPQAAQFRAEFGMVLLGKGEFARAEAECREAIRLDPKYAPAHFNLGEACRTQGRHAAAAAAYRAALAIQPNLGDARTGLDYCLRVQRGEVPTAPPPRAVGR